MLPITKQIKQLNCYAGQNRPSYIVIHETDNFKKGAGAAAHAKAHKGGSLSTSVHYYVDDKAIYQTLNHTDGAWAVGVQYGPPLVAGVSNCNTINIEICVNPDSDYGVARQNCIGLVRFLMNQTGISPSHVIRHYDAKLKWCPRKMMDSPDLWSSFKAGIISSKETLEYHEGFLPAADGSRWWYQFRDGSFARSTWYWLTEAAAGSSGWYLFDAGGYMLTGYQKDTSGETFFLCPDKGPDEGKCMITDGRGVMKIVEKYDFENHRYLINS